MNLSILKSVSALIITTSIGSLLVGTTFADENSQPTTSHGKMNHEQERFYQTVFMHVKDFEKFGAYAKQSSALFENYLKDDSVRFEYALFSPKFIKGNDIEQSTYVFVQSWKNKAAADAFFTSAAYQALIPAREASSYCYAINGYSVGGSGDAKTYNYPPNPDNRKQHYEFELFDVINDQKMPAIAELKRLSTVNTENGYRYGVTIKNTSLDGLGTELDESFVNNYDMPEMMTIGYYDSITAKNKVNKSKKQLKRDKRFEKLIDDATLIEGNNPAPKAE